MTLTHSGRRLAPFVVSVLLVVSLVGPAGAGLGGATSIGAADGGGDPSPNRASADDYPRQSPDEVDVAPALREAVEAGGAVEAVGGSDESAGADTIEVVVRMNVERSSAASPAATDTPAGLKAEAEATQRAFEAFAQARDGVEVTNRLWLANAIVVEIDPGRVDLEELAAVEGVERLHPDFAVEIDGAASSGGGPASLASPGTAPESGPQPTAERAPVRPSVRSAGALQVESGTTDATYGLEQINATTVWDEYGTKGAGASVAVLDTGVDADNHTDLDDALVGWKDFTYEGSADPTDGHGHGTHVSGTVVGEQIGDTGDHYGVAPDADLLHGRVLRDDGTGYFSWTVSGMEWAIENDADVISMSLGFEDGDYAGDFREVMENAEAAGTIVVSSSGNEGDGTATFPATVYDVFAVGATDESRDVASFSSGEVIDTADTWGDDAPDDWPDEYVVPNVAAPGVDVPSAYLDGTYARSDGTSMAAPHVSGAMALLLSIDGDLTPEEVRGALEETAAKPDGAPAPDGDPDTRYGYGIVDVYGAALAVMENGTIAGTVTASGVADGGAESIVAADDPIANATVTITDDGPVNRTTTTDENGTYAVADLPATVVGHDGYAVTVDGGEEYDRETAEGVQVSPNETTRRDFELDYAETGTVEGTVSIDVVGPDETVTVTVDAEDDPASDPTEVVLDHGNRSATYTLPTVSPAVDGDERTIVATADDYDRATINVSVGPDSTTTDANLSLEREAGTLDGWFAVDLNGTNAPVTEGEPLEVTVDVENLAAADERTVGLVVDGETVDEVAVDLEAGASNVTTLTHDTGAGDHPGLEVSAASPDDVSNASIVRVRTADPATFEIDRVELPGGAAVGDTIAVNATVTNVGDRAGNETVSLAVDGRTAVDDRALELDPGANETVTFAYELPAEPRAGVHEVDVTVETPHDDASDDLAVDYDTIGSGLDALGGGGVVAVAAGEYAESVAIDAPNVTIRGVDGPGETTLAPNPGDDVAISVDATSATVSRLTIDADGGTGIAVGSGADGATISRTVVNGSETGILVNGSDGHAVSDTVVRNVTTGVRFENATDAVVSATAVRGADGIVLGDGAAGTTIRESNLSVGADALTIDAGVGTGNRIERNNLIGDNASVVIAGTSAGGSEATGALESDSGTVLESDAEVTFEANYYGDGGSEATADGDVEDDAEVDHPYESATFDVTIVSAPGSAAVGDELAIDATVENVGDHEGTQDVELALEGAVVDAETDLALEGGATESVAFAHTLEAGDVGDGRTLTVRSDDASDDARIDVDEAPSFRITNLEAPAEATQGDDVDLTATAENDGGDGTVDVEVRYGDDLENPDEYEVLASESRDLAADASEAITLEVTLPTDGPTGLTLLGAATDDDREERFVRVAELEGESGDDGDGDGGNSGGGGGGGGQGGGGGGGSGVPSTPAPFPPSDVRVVEDVRDSIRAYPDHGVSVVRFEGVLDDAAIERITFDADDLAGEVRIRDYDRPSSVTGPPPGRAVVATEVLVPRGVEDEPATVRLRLERDDVGDADPADLRLARYHDDRWHLLETRVLETTAEDVLLEAETPGFSYFAVVATSEPTAAMSIDPETVAAGETVTLDGSDSTDRYGTIESYEWTVGDETATGETATVTLEADGEYEVTLAVTNDAGATDVATTTVTVVADDRPERGDESGVVGEDGVPGFGPAAGLVALIATVAALARTRRDRPHRRR